MAFDGLDMPTSLRLFHRDGTYCVAVNHPAVAAKLTRRWQGLLVRTEPIPPLDFHHFAVPDTAPPHELIRHAYQLARALPPEPPQAFGLRTAGIPRSTEAGRLVGQRVGQDLFREALKYLPGGAVRGDRGEWTAPMAGTPAEFAESLRRLIATGSRSLPDQMILPRGLRFGKNELLEEAVASMTMEEVLKDSPV